MSYLFDIPEPLTLDPDLGQYMTPAGADVSPTVRLGEVHAVVCPCWLQ